MKDVELIAVLDRIFEYSAFKVFEEGIRKIVSDLQQDKENLSDRFLLYQKCINQIDDYLEYQYKEKSAEEIRNTILGIIDKLTERLKEL